MENPPNFEVVVGTYEEYLLGYTLSPGDKVISVIIFVILRHNSTFSIEKYKVNI